MKKSLLLLMLFLMSGSFAHATDWIPVDTDDSNFYLYVDTDSIKNVNPQEYLYAIKFQSGENAEKVAYLKSNIKTNYMGVIKSEVFDESSYHPKSTFANVHVYMKPVDNESFLSLAHNYVSKLYSPESESANVNQTESKKDAFTPDSSVEEKQVEKVNAQEDRPEIRGLDNVGDDKKIETNNDNIKEETVNAAKVTPKEVQVLSGANDLKEYVAEISSKLNRNWQPPKSGRNSQAIIILTIGKDGSLQKYDIAKSSGDESTDRSIISAAEKSVPYAKFSNMKKGTENIKLQFVFEYKKFKKSVM